MSKVPRTIRIDGKVARRDPIAEYGRGKSGKWKHLESLGMGVHPSQIKEAEKIAAGAGVHTKYTRDGRAIMVSRSHRKKHMEVFGFHDKDAGYGDRAPEPYSESHSPDGVAEMMQ